jgi:hypothetical protein
MINILTRHLSPSEARICFYHIACNFVPTIHLLSRLVSLRWIGAKFRLSKSSPQDQAVLTLSPFENSQNVKVMTRAKLSAVSARGGSAFG